MITPTEFKALFPEFASEEDDRVQLFLDKAATKLDEARWDDLFDDGVAYLAAHNMKFSASVSVPTGSVADTKTMKKVGSLQTQHSEQALLKKMANPYMSTTYGQRFYYYSNLVGIGGVAT